MTLVAGVTSEFDLDPTARALPMGMRNRNPANIKFYRGSPYAGVVGPSVNTDQGDPQFVFSSSQAGMNAAGRLLLQKYRAGKLTANDIIASQGGWTPGNYQAAANVARTMGVHPGEDLRLTDPARGAAFLRASWFKNKGRTPPRAIRLRCTPTPSAAARPAPRLAGPPRRPRSRAPPRRPRSRAPPRPCLPGPPGMPSPQLARQTLASIIPQPPQPTLASIINTPGLRWASGVNAPSPFANVGGQPGIPPEAQTQLMQLAMMNAPLYGPMMGTTLASTPDVF